MVIATCALGAAREAGYWEDDAINAARVSCPHCGYDAPRLGIVVHLNDHHRWTREQIADWVESQERLIEPEPAPAVREDVDPPVVAIREKASSSSEP